MSVENNAQEGNNYALRIKKGCLTTPFHYKIKNCFHFSK